MKDTIEVPRKWIDGLLRHRSKVCGKYVVDSKAEVDSLLGYIDSARSFIDDKEK